MMNQGKMPAAVKLLILTAFTVVCWVLFEVYNVLKSDPPPPVPPAILEPVVPNLNTETLNSVEERVNLVEEEIGDTVLINPSGSVEESFGGGSDFSEPPIELPEELEELPEATPTEAEEQEALPL